MRGYRLTGASFSVDVNTVNAVEASVAAILYNYGIARNVFFGADVGFIYVIYPFLT
ncbi:hypothetical protein J5067_05900 [Candidatus Symbiopectobacterium sp. NZEC151]|nr:hypothetical protein [Candidatus Symbiopectobacterium sp. NZEC151]